MRSSWAIPCEIKLIESWCSAAGTAAPASGFGASSAAPRGRWGRCAGRFRQKPWPCQTVVDANTAGHLPKSLAATAPRQRCWPLVAPLAVLRLRGLAGRLARPAGGRPPALGLGAVARPVFRPAVAVFALAALGRWPFFARLAVVRCVGRRCIGWRRFGSAPALGWPHRAAPKRLAPA